MANASTASDGSPGRGPPTKTTRRIAYSLPLATGPDDTPAHRLGINAFAVAPWAVGPSSGSSEPATLLSASRDGAVLGWDLGSFSSAPDAAPAAPASTAGQPGAEAKPAAPATLRPSLVLRGHMDWVNDVAAPTLPSGIPCVISASNDRSVRLWRVRTDADASELPLTATGHILGHHNDYVKCLSYASGNQWMASGGLDRRIGIWDLGRETRGLVSWLSLPDSTPKQSIYTLSTHASGSLVVSGSPDKLIRLWDPRSQRKIGQLVGHTDHVRALLLSEDGRSVLSASSDATVKLWSLLTNRCVATFTHHSDSVWALAGDTSTFYSGGRDGTVFHTRVDYACATADGEPVGRSVPLFREPHGAGIHHVAHHRGLVFAGTSASAIRGWRDVTDDEWSKVHPILSTGDEDDVDPECTSVVVMPLSPLRQQPMAPLVPDVAPAAPSAAAGQQQHHEEFPSIAGGGTATNGNTTESCDDSENGIRVLRTSPAIEMRGEHGLIKHSLLSNKRHVLTLDTAGNVELWDIVRCIRIRSYGRTDFDAVRAEINTPEYGVNWCAVDTKIGTLSVQLNEMRCFDAEMYLDEAGVDGLEFQADQRTNVGRWVLVSLFRHLVNHVCNRPPEISPDSASIAAAPSSSSLTLGHGAAVPPVPPVPRVPIIEPPPTPSATAGPVGDYNQPPSAAADDEDDDRSSTSALGARDDGESSTSRGRSETRPVTPGTPSANSSATSLPSTPGSTTDLASTAGSEQGTRSRSRSRSQSLVSRLRRISLKRLSKASLEDVPAAAAASSAAAAAAGAASTPPKPSSIPLVQGKLPTLGSSSVTGTTSTATGSSSGAAAAAKSTAAASAAAPTAAGPPGQPAPVPIPNSTVLAITEDEADACSSVSRWAGTVGSTALDAAAVQAEAPEWLLDVLLRDVAPGKDPVKIGFILAPAPGSNLPSLESGNSRLLANRMVRVRRILSYILDNTGIKVPHGTPVEEYLQLVIAGQPVNPMLTLATVKTYIWRAGGDGDLSAVYRLVPPKSDGGAAA
ncbi:hypothetical protein H9P43_001287 [Blastocladiella emersonii ATCC 22665]|nr:hypothetical protein H9P43_001287 [Blastocladiella emersonii ATCC 22665]